MTDTDKDKIIALLRAEVKALQDARKAPRGHIIDDQGVVRKVLGTFVLTDEGCVVGNGAKVYLMSDNWRDGKYVYQVTASVDLGEPDDRKCFEDPTNAAAYLKQRIDAAEKAKEAMRDTDAAGALEDKSETP